MVVRWPKRFSLSVTEESGARRRVGAILIGWLAVGVVQPYGGEDDSGTCVRTKDELLIHHHLIYLSMVSLLELITLP